MKSFIGYETDVLPTALSRKPKKKKVKEMIPNEILLYSYIGA